MIDASWPVRDRACIAIGRYIRSIWNRDIDVNSPIQVKSISIPTIQDILEYDQGQRLSEELVESSQEEKLSILTIMQEAIDILLNYLRTDPFHPVRESAAISLIDCILPPVTALGVSESLLKVFTLTMILSDLMV